MYCTCENSQLESLTVGDVSKIIHIGMKCVPCLRNYAILSLLLIQDMLYLISKS